MAAGLAHEIRNPLASISGAIQMLRTSRDGNEIEKRLMDIIMRSKEQLENFLKDFLLMAKTIPGVREEVDLNLLIKETLESLRTVDDWHEPLNVRVSLPDSPLTIYANRNEIKQVIWNIVLNAIQAMPNGGRLEIKAFPYIRRGQNGIAVEVGDTGVGIEKENIPKIFEPFYTTREVGTGLGLAVVQRIVEGYKGAIEIESEKGERTLCKVWLPKH
jgi:signal transduction histidine kinase